MAVWFPSYARAYGLWNFVALCDMAVALTWLGLVTGSALLLSSQALSSLLVDLLWALDVASRLALGRHLIGGTEYMFDPRLPLGLRLLSLFHVVLPLLLLWALSRTGYDRRALALQSAIALVAILLARLAGPEANLNFSFRDPFAHGALGPVPVHLAVTLLGLIGGAYVPTHLVLTRLYPPPRT